MLLEDRMERRRLLKQQSDKAEKFIAFDEARKILEKITVFKTRSEFQEKLESELGIHKKFDEKRTGLELKLKHIDDSIDEKQDGIQKMEENLLKGADVEQIRELEQMKATLTSKEKERGFLQKEYAN